MKRFYTQVSIQQHNGGWQVMLDGRGLKTVKGAQQLAPTPVLADMLANEWDAQGDEIDPKHFIYRDMADYAIDVIAGDKAAVAEKLLTYAETDTLCYRADPEEPLFARQQEEWEPLLTQLERRESISFTRISGIIHRDQPAETLARLRQCIADQYPFVLASLEAMTSLSASLTIGLLALDSANDAEQLWRAASLEEEWQADLWGRDEEAEERRAKRRNAFLAARAFAKAAQS